MPWAGFIFRKKTWRSSDLSAADLAAPQVDVARIRPLLAMEADRARECYSAGEELIPLVNEDSQPALWVLITIYRRLLEKIASNQYDVFSERVRLTRPRKAHRPGKRNPEASGVMPASIHPNTTNSPTVAIAGGGLAGLAAGCALAEAGFRVSLFERRPYLGGRASSYQHPGTGEIVDNCQHVLLGCCTNLLDFYRRAGVQDKIRWYEKLTFPRAWGARIGDCAVSAARAAAYRACISSRRLFEPFATRSASAGPWRRLLRRLRRIVVSRFSTGSSATDKLHRQSTASGRRFWSAR